MREEVELLEDDPDPLPDRARRRRRPRDLLALEEMRPAWIGSRRLTQRSSVLLPLPLGPITTRTSPVGTSRSMPSRTRLSPKLFRTPSSRRIGPRCRLGVSVSAGVWCSRGSFAVRCPGSRFRHRMGDSRQRQVGSQVEVTSYPSADTSIVLLRGGRQRVAKAKKSSPRGANRMKHVLIACVAVAALAVPGAAMPASTRRRRDHVHRVPGRAPSRRAILGSSLASINQFMPSKLVIAAGDKRHVLERLVPHGDVQRRSRSRSSLPDPEEGHVRGADGRGRAAVLLRRPRRSSSTTRRPSGRSGRRRSRATPVSSGGHGRRKGRSRRRRPRPTRSRRRGRTTCSARSIPA